MARKNKNARRQSRQSDRIRTMNRALHQAVTEQKENMSMTEIAEPQPIVEQPVAEQLTISDVPAPVSTQNVVRQVRQRIESIPLDRMILDVYQRALNTRNIAAIARNFNEARLGVLVVSERSNDFYAVLDGQHRLAAMRQLGIQAANCIVLEGMTLQEEAEFFRRQSENKQNLGVKDLFNAGVYAEDAQCVEIQRLLDKYGFHIGYSRRGKSVNALDALVTIVKLYGYDVLEYTLAVIDATWPNDGTIMRREMLAALAEFGHRFRSKVDVSHFAARMQTKMPADLCRDAKSRNRGGSTPGTAFHKQIRFTSCGVLVDAYNKGLNSNSRNRLRFSWNDAMMEDEANV